MLKIVTLLWDVNHTTSDHSRCYDESWVCKLHDAVRRNLTRPHQFVLFTDRRRDFGTRDIMQIMLRHHPPSYSSRIEPYRLNDPMIVIELDTVIVGNIDELADYCLNGSIPAVPRDPHHPVDLCTAVVLAPAGCRDVYDEWDGFDDIRLLQRYQKRKIIDYLFPGRVQSFAAAGNRLHLDTRIVFFHGQEKPHNHPGIDWVQRHWRTSDE